jgi:hypothetical protein
MDVTTRIERALADEHVIAVDPPLRPELPGVWRRRINPFAGRALSDKALTAEQDSRAGLQRLQGLALAPGTVEGLEILVEGDAPGQKPEGAFFQLSPGLGIARTGEDVSVGGARRISFGDLPVILRTDHADALAGEGEPVEDSPTAGDGEGDAVPEGMSARLMPVLPRRMGGSLATLSRNKESRTMPHVGVLVAQPVTATILGRPMDECRPDPRDDAYVDLQRIDGCRLAFYLWPAEATARSGGPDYALPPADAAMRNRLAYRVFDNEKLLLADEMHPWEEWGVPLAVAAFDDQWRLDFVDRFAVARTGGTPRPRTPLVPSAGEPRLWQARIDQFVAHLSDLPALDEATLRDAFVRMPPVGLLPPDLFDPILRRQLFFPGSYGVSAVPIARSNLDLAIREAAPLASLNRGIPDRVELLVPVPDSAYDPHLLEREAEDPRFAEAIGEFLNDRAMWLGRREAARRRYDRLLESVSGQVGGWPGADLPMEENCPEPRTQVPVEISRTRRFREQTALRTHHMMGAQASLPVGKGDRLWFWLRIHSASGLTGLALRLGNGTSDFGDLGTIPRIAGGVFWGTPDMFNLGDEGRDIQLRRIGDLPEPNVWHRLEVPVDREWRPDGRSLEGFLIDNVEFAQHGGDVEWGSFGKIDSAGRVYTYIGDDAPPGAVLQVSGSQQPGWPWEPVPGRQAPGVPEAGTVSEGGVRRVAAIDAFRAQWTQPFLAAEMARIDENGIGAFLTDVEARLKATNDAVDLGFVRARSDIYRVRQIMLGAEAASRLVTSPTLADLASRDEGARATSKGIGEFLKDLNQRPKFGQPAAPPPATPNDTSRTPQRNSAAAANPPQEAVVREGFGARKFLGSATVMSAAPVNTMMAINVNAFAGASAEARMMRAADVKVPSFSAAAAVAEAARPITVVPPTASAHPAAMTLPMVIMPAMQIGSVAAAPQPGHLSISAIAKDIGHFRGADIRRQIPLAGLVDRTLTVAERMTLVPAEQALKYALATKDSILATLSRLTSGPKPTGIALSDLPVPGFAAKEGVTPPPPPPTLALVLEDRPLPSDRRRYIDEDSLPADKDEAAYFTATVKAIDNSVAMMRLVEARVTLFEELGQSLHDLREEIEQHVRTVASYLRSVGVEVEEARHDVGTAERLRAEEAERVAGINARREAVLAGQVEAIAWRRVREAGHRSTVPTLEIASALAPDPVVVCRREHEDVPDEIEDYVELLRDAPVKWFPRIAAEVSRIDRLSAIVAAIEKMRERAALPLMIGAPTAATALPKLLRGVQQALVAQRRVVEERRSMVARISLAALPTLSLVQAQVQIRETASLGDLIGGRHRQPILTRMASEEIDGVAQVAGCLHAAFGEVAPAIRLGWAEILSEFDRPAPLDSLAGLPGWAEVPMELRRTLDSFVDWLFARIDRSIPEARNAMNELVRVAMLMASHAPVDRIIPARLVEPAPARIGARLQLAIDSRRIRRGMAAVIRDRENRIVSRAVLEDIVDGHASAVLTHNLAAVASITADMRIELVAGGA